MLAQTGATPVPTPVRLTFEPIALEPGIVGHTPHLSSGPDGKTHLIWMSATEEEGETRVSHRAWKEGVWSDSQVLAQGKRWFVNWADFPQYQEDNDGGGVLSWLAHAEQGHGYGVMFRKRREAGAAWSMPQVLHEDREAVEHGFVSLVALGEGRYFANWLQSTKDGPPTALRGGVIGSDGKIAKESVLDPLVCDCCGTDSILLPSGNVLVAYRNRSEEEFRDIQVVRGTPGEADSWKAPVTITGERWKTATCPVNGPALASDGSFVALAYFTGDRRKGTTVRLVLSRGGGNRWMPAKILTGGSNVLGRVDVSIMPDKGPVVVTWLERTEDGAQWCARAVPRKGPMGPVLRFAHVSGGRKDGFLQTRTTSEGVMAAWTDSEKGSVQLGLLKFEEPD